LRVSILSRRLVVFMIAVNFITAGTLITKAFDAAMWPGEFVPAVIAAVLSGLNIMAGSIFIDFLKEDECI
jgi:hypothetical protein